MSNIIKTGIICDDYKLRTYKRALKRAGFNYEIKGAFTKGTTAVQVTIQSHELSKLKSLCEKLENNFRAQRN